MDQLQDAPSNLSWIKHTDTCKGNNNKHRPEPRSGHTLNVVGTNAYVFGGIVESNDGDAFPSNDIFQMRFGSSSMEWQKYANKGPQPLPRWRHTANVFDGNQLLVIGGFHTHDHRLNDVWVFDIIGETWFQPNQEHNKEALLNHQLGNPSWTNCMTPRASHTTTIIGDNAYIFGGYGGSGYSRRDLDDLYSLNVKTWAWTKVQAKGSVPEKRSGHQACAVEQKIFVFGGWNSGVQFNDLFILDVDMEPPVWSSINSTMAVPTWNHAACSVMAIPTWKVFTFGGVTGVLSDTDRQGTMVDTLAILETGNARWTYPTVEGKGPPPRADTAMAYDVKNSRLLVFGGWSDQWHCDLYSLDVGNVVGPPYAITDMVPRMGPITGGTNIIIHGIDFVNTADVVVRFGTKRQYVDVPGTFINQTKLSCVSPDYTKFAAAEVQVRVALSGDSFTTTFQKFSFFSVTNASKSIMFGPGLLSGCAINEDVSFIIQARDDNGVNRTTGGDQYLVFVTLEAGGDDGEDLPLNNVFISDQNNGKYIVTYTAPYGGRYQVNVQFLGTFGGKAGALKGSGVKIDFDPKAPRDNNLMAGDLIMRRLQEDIMHLQALTQHLSDGIFVRVKDDSWSAEEHIRVLVKVKESLIRIDEEEEKTTLLVERCEAIMEFLHEQDVDLNRLDEYLSIGKVAWEKILREAPQIQAKIQPMMRAHASKIRNDIQSYERHVTLYKEQISKAEFIYFATGPLRSIALLNKADELHAQKRNTCNSMLHIATIFECSKDMNTAKDVVAEVDELLADFRVMWDCNQIVVSSIEEAKLSVWAHINPDELEDNAKRLIQSIRRLPRSIRNTDAFKGLDKIAKEFLNTCPLISSLCSPAMRERHWRELMDVVKREFLLPAENPNMLLRDLLDLELHTVSAEVEDITEKAAKEARHEETLRNLEVVWSSVQFSMQWYKETDVPLLKLEEENVEQLESDQMAVQSIVGSRYPHFKKEASVWQHALGAVSEVVQTLADIQRMWSYLEPLFIGSEEVKKELPEDAQRFKEIDTQVKTILQRAWKIRNVKSVCTQNGLLKTLQELEQKQEACKKSLSEFLDGKRRQFPRFYFMSESDLLDLLSNSSQPEKVLMHVDKILLATKALTLESSKDGLHVTTFIAGVGKEVVKIDPPMRIIGKAEHYLLSLLKSQRATLSKCLSSSVTRYSTFPRVEWLLKKDAAQLMIDPAQISLLVAQIDFVSKVEKAMVKFAEGVANALPKYLDIVKSQLEDLINLTQSALTPGDRQRIMCMITLDAHNRDIADTLIREKAYKATDFQWQSKLRPKFVAESKIATEVSSAQFSICDAQFDYGFEYLGNGPRLVVTPLTDRIYVTATQALNLKMGCAPAGPAGTGKTETTKDLASALGKCCYVFNCSPEMDYQSMGNIFKGLAASGSWGCFDEFNRLIPEVLSVCSVQFKAVCDSLRNFNHSQADIQKVTIEGDTVSLDPTCGAFITMNPGYLGRSELPEGLKALFRPITVIVPDLVLICENMLMAEGFLTAKVLASKFYGLYSLLAELLSKQAHYDWGLRAVKSVLVVAGILRRAEPNLAENALLMRALRDFNIPKIVQADEIVFFGLLNDLFPDLNPPRVLDENLAECVATACEENGLWPDTFFSLKVLQLDELLDIRHCVFVMGPPGSGKSACWKMLQAARNIQNPAEKVKTVDLNPKVMPTEDLYGHISMSTREWKDGLLSSLLRDLGRIPNDNPKWMILDGDLDANWIESMNSVMDDNKMLTLASNERIPLKSYMRMIFEIRDLKYATPATVSRAGILYISMDNGSQWRSIIGSWVRSRPDELFEDSDREKAHGYFEKYLPDSLKFFVTSLKGVVSCNDISLSVAVLSLLDTLLTRKVITDDNAFESAFVFCLIWGIGSVLTITDDGTDYRKIFSEWFRGKFKSVKLPNRDTVFDYWLDLKTSKFESWKVSPAFRVVEFDSFSMNMAEVTVPTAETASVSYWLESLVHKGRHVMLAGPAGTGKTQLVGGMLNSLNSENHIPATVNMNFYTSSNVLLTSLEAPLQKRTGSVYGPPGSAKLVYFVDDMNLPEVDLYGTQSSIALIRQHIDYGHWYDIQKLTLKSVDDCQYVAALNPTAGSFFVNPRLQRHFTTFAIGMPSATSLLTIYETFLNGHLNTSGFSQNVISISSGLIKGALAVHKEVAETFRKTAANFHYEFNIRHLANVFQGLLIATPQIFNDSEKFVFLWLHESERVYGDRLVDADDLSKFKQILLNQARKTFVQFNVARFYLQGNGVQSDPLVFCHFADGTTQGSDLTYNRSTDLALLRKTLELALDEFNESHAVMNLVLFNDAVLHVARIVRIVKQTGGHALLVGVGGSGKQSLARLAAHVCNYSAVQITVNQHYSMLDFKSDLQGMYNKAGIKNEGVLFLLTDTQINNEKYFVYLNDLLSSGNIPDLYSRDETDAIINTLTNKAKSAGYSSEPAHVWRYFISRIRENLHVCLCFSPMGPGLRTRARRFPAVANCTVIDWFQPWPEQALASVGKKILSDCNLGTSEQTLSVEIFMPTAFLAVNKMCKLFASTEGKQVYTTPKSYLEMLHLFLHLLSKRRSDTDASMKRLQNGVEKLIRAAGDVVELEANLKIMLVSAEDKRAVAAGIAEDVRKEKEIVEQENARAIVEAAKVKEIQTEVAVKQADASADLAQAEPALMRAMAALDSLDRRDLGNCKTMTKPPPGVDDVFSAVTVLLAGVNPNVIIQKNGKVRDKDRSWDAAKKALLGNVNGFMDELKGFKINIDEGSVPEVNWKEVRPFLQLEHFFPDIIEKRNSAAAGLCSWVINIVNYFDIVQLVEPKRIALKAANEQLNSANEQLSKVLVVLAELQAKLDKLTEEYNAAESSRLEAQHIAEKGKMKLELASRLTKALGSEKVRWSEGIERLVDEREYLVGDCLLAAAFISYIGPFTKEYREILLDKTLIPLLVSPASGEPVPITPNIDALSIVCTEAEIAEYQTQGLPADRVSSENGAIVMNSVRYPLMIDPQLQAITWIKRRFASTSTTRLQLGRLGQKDLIKRLLKSVEDGDNFLIENMGESVDATLMPVISRTSVKRGSKKILVIGDQEVEINPAFKLFLHTKLSNPHYPPEIQAETTLVNFSVTQKGLEDQLLAMVVQHERLDLATQRSALILQQNLFTIRVKQLEDNILKRLAEAQGDITEDRALIEELELSKKISHEIAQKLEDSRITSEKIEKTSENYRPVARRGSLLFFVMNNLHKIHTYYMYSLNNFFNFFLRGIRCAGMEGQIDEEAIDSQAGVGFNSDVDLDVLGEQILKRVSEIEERDLQEQGSGSNIVERLEQLKQSVSRTVYNFVRSGLFERDKLTVATLITLRVMLENGSLKKPYVDVMMRARMGEDVPAMSEEISKWASENAWARLKALEEDLGGQDPVFAELMERIGGDADDWEEWYNRSEPENHPMPGEFRELGKDIRALIILRILRPDRLPIALSGFVQDNLGEDFVIQAPFAMANTYRDTTAKNPVLFVLYPGVDPTSWVEDLGREHGITAENGLFANISMGQGQEAGADEMIRRLGKAGGWIFLQNVHLMQTWLPTLDEKLETLSPNKNFRVFISAEPPPLSYLKNIPESLLQSCICIANEPPSDLRSNLARAWSVFGQSRIDGCVKINAFKACLFGLCFFHSLMLGRRRFGSQGWSRAYGFNVGDLRICADVLETNLNRDITTVPFQDLRYIFGEIMYGGHITDFFDRRTNNTYLQVIFNDKLLNRGELAPKLMAPDPSLWEYHNYSQFIAKTLPPESPMMYGLHPNAEIGFLTNKAENLFDTILRLEIGSSSSSDSTGNMSSILREVLLDLMLRCPSQFDLVTLADRFKEKVSDQDLPYGVVVMQECTRINTLLFEMKYSLEELQKGLNGQLNMSQGMEDMVLCLGINQVPGRNPFHACSWERFAWASRKSLSSWFADLLLRKEQLEKWTENLLLPYSVWLPGLLNPTALLTAIMQVTARKRKLPLDNMTIDTHVTRMLRVEEAFAQATYPEDGIFIHGMLLEGARWTNEEESAEFASVVGTTPCAGHLTESRLKQLLTPMPLVYVKAVAVNPEWSPESVGYLRSNPSLYECPVYLTSARGNTFVFLSTLFSVNPTHRWILAGVAILLQSDD